MKVELKGPRKTSYLLNIVVFNLCRLVPMRNKRLWIFGAREGEKYDENSKYMFEYVQNNHSDTIRAIWLTKDPQVVEQVKRRGYESELNGSWKGKWSQLRAGVALYSHGLLDFGIVPLVGGAEVVALWHGMGFKKIYNGKYTGLTLRTKKFLDHLFSWTYRNVTPVTSEYARQWVSEIFTLKESEVYITGQPRNDALRMTDREGLLSQLGIDPQKKIIIYMPTYRHYQMGTDAMEKIVKRLYDSRELNDVLNAENATFVVKLHPLTPHIDLPNKDNFITLDYNAVEDNQQLMAACDMLVTDFSSCFVDYALTHRPIIFYLPDEEAFLSQSESMEQGFFNISKLNKAVTEKELAEKIVNPSSIASEATNTIFEDPSIEGTCYSENVYNVIVNKLGIN